MALRFAALLATVLVFPHATGAQPPQTMPRDRPAVRADGTASIKGRIVDGLTGAAVPRARVRLIGRGGNRTTVMTDAAGVFAFTKLPGGPYTLLAEKSGFLPSRYPTGPTVRVRMKPVVIADGESLENITVGMFRTSAIAGRVVDAHGDPVEFAHVQLMRLTPGQQPTTRGGENTNDIGEFRVGRLEPGTYLLLAVARRMPREDPRDVATGPASTQPLPTYYPGVLSLEQAQPITLERGQSATGIELVLGEGVPTVVTGTLVTAEGGPVGENAWVNVALMNGAQRIEVPGLGAGVRPDGTFRVELAPGEYVLEARAMRPPTGKESGPEDERHGRLRLTVGASAIESVTIVLGRPALATGKIVFEGSTPPPKPPTGPVWVPLNSADEGPCSARQAHVNPDWTFRVEGLVGTCTAPVQPMFGGWMLKSVTVNGENVLTRAIAFEPGQQLRDVQVVFTDRRSSMTFRVTDDAGQSTRDYVVLVFFTDQARWQKTPYVRTYVPPQVHLDALSAEPRAASPVAPAMPPRRPETIEALAPGEYYVAAVEDVDVEALRSVELLERLIPSAARVSVTEGAHLDVALRRVKLHAGR